MDTGILSRLSLSSLILGILGVFGGLTSIPAIVCGHLGLSRIRASPAKLKGRKVAIAGLTLGYITALGFAVVWVGVVVSLAQLGSKIREDRERPSEKVARGTMELTIAENSNDLLQLVSFNKINGVKGMSEGIPFYRMEYAVVVKATSNIWVDTQKEPFQATTRKPASWFGQSQSIRLESGERMSAKGLLRFIWTEQGWQGSWEGMPEYKATGLRQ